MNIWEEFDNNVDVEGLQKDIKDAEENGGTRKEVPHGNYEVKINKMELKKSQKGDPMLSIWFKVLAGEYANCLIFMNQLVVQGIQIHIANEFLRSLDSGVDIEFKSYSQYAGLIEDVLKSINAQKLEYELKFEDNKGYNKFTIANVFEG